MYFIWCYDCAVWRRPQAVVPANHLKSTCACSALCPVQLGELLRWQSSTSSAMAIIINPAVRDHWCAICPFAHRVHCLGPICVPLSSQAPIPGIHFKDEAIASPGSNPKPETLESIASPGRHINPRAWEAIASPKTQLQAPEAVSSPKSTTPTQGQKSSREAHLQPNSVFG